MVELSVKLQGSKASATVEVPALDVPAATLFKAVQHKLEIPSLNGLRFLSGGKFLQSDVNLASQRVKEGSKILVMGVGRTSDSEPAARASGDVAGPTTRIDMNISTADTAEFKTGGDSVQAGVDAIVAAAVVFAKRHEGQEGASSIPHFSLTTPEGDSVELPQAEREALVVGMTLHDKAKTFLHKKGRSEVALLLLLQSYEYFTKCSPSVLLSIDNIAFVCQDIVWCYIEQRDMARLRDAHRWLDRCQAVLRRCFGPEDDTLTGPEQVAYMRLTLMYGIVAVADGRTSEARIRFQRTQSYLDKLSVDKDSLTEMISMGFSEKEAKRSLRACRGNVVLARQRILDIRAKEKQALEREKAKRSELREVRQFGLTNDGKAINREIWTGLQAAGFDRVLSGLALRRAGNDPTQAVALLTSPDAVSDLAEGRSGRAGESLTPGNVVTSWTDQDVVALASMGFEVQDVKFALNQSHGVREHACNLLLNGPFACEPSTSQGSARHDEMCEDSDSCSKDYSSDGSQYSDLSDDSAGRIESALLDEFDPDSNELDGDYEREVVLLKEFQSTLL